MKYLLTSSGIKNPSLNEALVALLGKPISESTALVVVDGVYPFPGGARMGWEAICGKAGFSGLGWKSLGLLELTALPSIKRENWSSSVRETDALLVWGGDVLYLHYWMKKSGLAELLPSLNHVVYFGVSAGSIVMTSHNCDYEFNLTTVPEGDERASLGDGGLGLVDFAIRVHLDREGFDSSMADCEAWAADLPVPTYALDDESAIRVVDGQVDVISEGNWTLFNPRSG